MALSQPGGYSITELAEIIAVSSPKPDSCQPDDFKYL
jgi:hypothetical protein